MTDYRIKGRSPVIRPRATSGEGPWFYGATIELDGIHQDSYLVLGTLDSYSGPISVYTLATAIYIVVVNSDGAVTLSRSGSQFILVHKIRSDG